MGGICVALVLSDGSAVYLVGESTESDNVNHFNNTKFKYFL